MFCKHPRHGFRGSNGGFVETASRSPSGERLTIPCGGCVPCRIGKAEDWSTRFRLETQVSERACFGTLTYRPDDYPDSGSLEVRDIQLFMKRFRSWLHAEFKKRGLKPPKIRYFVAGEYAPDTWRVHWHFLIWGWDFPDRVPVDRTERGDVVYSSQVLEKLWGKGQVQVDDVNEKRCKYVGRYAMKKVGGRPAREHYSQAHPYTGEIVDLEPEFALMSSKPGIGAAWFARFKGDCYPSDFVVVDGEKLPVPKYFDRLLHKETLVPGDAWLRIPDRSALGPIKEAREERALLPQNVANSTPERLLVRGEVLERKVERLKRSFGA